MTFLKPKHLLLLQPVLLAGLTAGILLGRAMPLSLLLCCVCLIPVVAAVYLLQNKGRLLALGVAALVLGTALGSQAFHPTLPEEGTYTVSGVSTEAIRPGKATQYRTVLRDVTLNGEAYGSGAYWSFYTAELPEGVAPGAQVTLTAKLYHPDDEDNEGGFNFREYLLQQNVTIGIYGLTDLTVSSRFSILGSIASLRQRLSDGLMQVMGESAGGYASAMLLGTSYLVPSEDKAAFNRLGIGHILSVSGFHVGVLVTVVSLLLKKCGADRKLQFFLLTCLLVGYSLLTGFKAPVVRASLLVLLALGARLCHRRSWPPLLLTTAAIVQLLLTPTQITSAGFHLTYGALLGIFLVTDTLTHWKQPLHQGTAKLWQMIAGMLGAQLGILLPELYWYQELPLLGLVLNLFVFAISSLLLCLYWLVLLLQAVPWLGGMLGQLAAWCTTLLTDSTRLLAQWDGLVLWTKQANLVTALGWVILLAVCTRYILLSRKKRFWGFAAGTALLLASLVILPHQGTEYIQFSEGNADAAVLYDADQVIVIDTGEENCNLADWLHRNRLSVDALFLTHLHSDHAGGLQDLLDSHIPIKVCYLSTEATKPVIDEEILTLLSVLEATGTEIRTVSRGDSLPLPSGSITVLWP